VLAGHPWPMSRRPVYTRRAVIGGAIAAAAIPAAAPAAPPLGRRPAPPAAHHPHPGRRHPGHRVIAENSLPGDPHWWISKTGAPDAIMGYAGQASVLPGEP